MNRRLGWHIRPGIQCIDPSLDPDLGRISGSELEGASTGRDTTRLTCPNGTPNATCTELVDPSVQVTG